MTFHPQTSPQEPGLRIESITDIDIAVNLRIEFLILMGGPLDEVQESQLRQATHDQFRSGFLDGSFYFLAAYVDQNLVGCACLLEQSTLPNRRVPLGRIGLILNVHVQEEYRGRGIARALMHALEACGRRRGLERLQLNATPEGQILYRKLGWHEPLGGMALELSISSRLAE